MPHGSEFLIEALFDSGAEINWIIIALAGFVDNMEEVGFYSLIKIHSYKSWLVSTVVGFTERGHCLLVETKFSVLPSSNLLLGMRNLEGFIGTTEFYPHPTHLLSTYNLIYAFAQTPVCA